MNEYDIQVDLEHGLVFHKQIDLVQNDYNSTVFNFKFNNKDYSNYTKVFQLEYPDGQTWTKEIKEDKITLADLNEENVYVPILTQSGKYYFDIVIYDESSKLTTTKKSYFKVREKISGENIELDDRLPILDDLINSATKNINETNNLDIDLQGSILTIVKKDGTVKSEDVRGPQGFIAFEELTPEQKEELRGPQGLSATIEIGLVETVEPNEKAEVINSGTDNEAILNFRLPKGKDGYTPVKGIDYFDGKDGEKGDAYSITENDYQSIANVVEKDIQPTLNNNLKSAKDYTDNAIIRDIKDITYNENTATFTFIRHDNTTFTVDLPIEATVADGRYDDSTKELVLVLVSGQEIKIPVSGLIDDYDGLESATIQCVVSADNKITCNIKSGSISKTLLTAELQQEISNKVNIDDVEEEILYATLESGETRTIKLVTFK